MTDVLKEFFEHAEVKLNAQVLRLHRMHCELQVTMQLYVEDQKIQLTRMERLRDIASKLNDFKHDGFWKMITPEQRKVLANLNVAIAKEVKKDD